MHYIHYRQTLYETDYRDDIFEFLSDSTVNQSANWHFVISFLLAGTIFLKSDFNHLYDICVIF